MPAVVLFETRVTFVVLWTNVRVAPATAAPVESVTAPVIWPVGAWPQSAVTSAAAHRTIPLEQSVMGVYCILSGGCRQPRYRHAKAGQAGHSRIRTLGL